VTKISWAQNGSSKDMGEAGLVGEGIGVWPRLAPGLTPALSEGIGVWPRLAPGLTPALSEGIGVWPRLAPGLTLALTRTLTLTLALGLALTPSLNLSRYGQHRWLAIPRPHCCSSSARWQAT